MVVPARRDPLWRLVARILSSALREREVFRQFRSWQAVWLLLHKSPCPGSVTWQQLFAEFTIDDLLAAAKLAREKPGNTLQATALVNEAWMRLFGKSGSFKNRRHFFGAAAEAMRRILVDRARHKARLKRGSGQALQDIDDYEIAMPEGSIDLIALDEALEQLASEAPDKAELVKLRYFTGLSILEAAEILEISKATADRWWSYARAFLFHEISKGEERAET